jgi:hypothetical protein
VSEYRIEHPLGESYLYTPVQCAAQPCPLIVVSHTRGRTAADFRLSPFVRLYLDAFLERGFAVLLSSDAGPRTWGNPAALNYLGAVHAQAVRRFAWNRRTYAFGLSMGGLSALRSALIGPYPVFGVALLDAHVSLDAALRDPSDTSRQTEVAQAYGLSGAQAALPLRSDPLDLIRDHPALPVFMAGSPDDTAVPFSANGLALFAELPPTERRLLNLSGPHLGGSHFAPEVVAAFADFFAGQERRVVARAKRR